MFSEKNYQTKDLANVFRNEVHNRLLF